MYIITLLSKRMFIPDSKHNNTSIEGDIQLLEYKVCEHLLHPEPGC